MTTAGIAGSDDLAEFDYGQPLDRSIGTFASFAAGIGERRADLIEPAR
jgi:hypothetical protein